MSLQSGFILNQFILHNEYRKSLDTRLIYIFKYVLIIKIIFLILFFCRKSNEIAHEAETLDFEIYL